MRILIAAVLGFVGLFLLFFVGEGIEMSHARQGGGPLDWAALIAAIGVYFFFVMFLLSRGLPRGKVRLWTWLALNASLVLASALALSIEPNRAAAFQAAALAVLALVCSGAGAAMAVRGQRRGGP